MAVYRRLYASNSNNRDRSIEVWVHFDTDIAEADWPDYEIGPADATLVEFEIVVTGRPYTVTIWRPQGNSKTPWRTAQFDPGPNGETVTHNVTQGIGTGQMQTVGDLAAWSAQVN